MKTKVPASALETGYALITAMIFLILLTLVALVAIRGTGMEVKMSANNAARTEAFESSEFGRTAVDGLIDTLCYARGWPQSIFSGSSVSDAAFDRPIPTGLTLLPAGAPEYWCSAPNDEAGGFKPNSLQVDAIYSLNYPSGGAAPAAGDVQLNSQISVYRLYAAGAPGSGQAQAYGYSAPGVAAANGGGNIFFYVQSRGADTAGSAAQAGDTTGAAFRYVIRN